MNDNTHNIVTLDIAQLMSNGDHYNTASQHYGKRMAQQARELMRELGIDVGEELEDLEGFAENGPEGIEAMFEAAGLWIDPDAESMNLEDLHGWEQHGIYAVEGARRDDRQMVRVKREEYDQGNGVFAYVGDHAQGNGRYTIVPDYAYRARCVANRAAAKPITVADMFREARTVAGLKLPVKAETAFRRAHKGATPTLADLLQWAKDNGYAK